jgi:SRSO17 transposase
MVSTTSDWRGELGRWLKPFLDRLGHKARRQMCPLYVSELIGPGDRKSVQPMAERVALGDYDQLHHFVSAGVWDAGPVETELLVQADKLVGGSDAVLMIDDTAIPKKGTHSVGVAAQYASALGKTANCQTLVALTLARGEVPVVLALRLFLPESWTCNRARLKRASVPAEYRKARTKPEMALAEIDRVIAAGVRFGCVLADAGYGMSAPFRQGLTARKLSWAVIKARWICEQAHQQMKEELGLDHFEGRSWQGLHRHALMTMIAYAFLQHRRLATARRKKKNQRAAASANFARHTPRHSRTLRSTTAAAMSTLPKMDLQRAAA